MLLLQFYCHANAEHTQDVLVILILFQGPRETRLSARKGLHHCFRLLLHILHDTIQVPANDLHVAMHCN